MTLHIPTLLIVSVFIFCVMGLLTLHAWSRETRERPLAYLGSMMLLVSLGMLLVSLRGLGVDFVPVVLGNIALLLGAAMNWTAMRVLAGRAPWLPGILAGVVTWLILCLVPAFMESLSARVTAYSLLTVAYGSATVLEFWRSQRSLEVSYLPAFLLTLLHTVFYCIRAVYDTGLGQDQALAGAGKGTSFFSFMLFEAMVYVIGIAYMTLAMVKERAELRFKAAAYSDALTGIGNRRAFMSRSEQLLESCKRRGTVVALLLCDLDHFKRLNDTFGHAVGDQALIAFSRVMSRTLHKLDVFGRIGGEEFACLLESDEAAAVDVAERIRLEFAALPLLEPGLLSVSIGVVTTRENGHDLSRLLSLADEALYGAKGKGRNRVEVAPGSAAAWLMEDQG
ncbi:GGDEF domain-containing protein [Pseudomonas vanderleydeniana]|uniref:diguanylate cyclase n=1 Tax=Pseudomonas vanderleydeniana TaxID=2745495 RepID=A0A9E6TRG2_9PSED|nr:GGDEF domain-containing protein [Pseudomonas vanderleydeniana]QXI27884.1 GGDEF domain-containing protein [Pseudomonas vanderleydeniana]